MGRWDEAGGTYTGGGGLITLITSNGRQVTMGNKINNHLYKMKMSLQGFTSNQFSQESPKAFVGNETALSWETWHCQYGHVRYTGLQNLLRGNLVKGFNVNVQTPKPDCITCTQVKQHVELFPKAVQHNMKPGELTHIDVWGKYAVKSINNNQYYLLFVDDAKQYITVKFLKNKLDAAQETINYLVLLMTQGHLTKGIQIHCGKEFINNKLETHCKEKGIQIRMTAPYSPAQNGVTEQMNRMLVELA